MRVAAADKFKKPLEYLAVWQLLCFLLLICLLWAFELLDVPHLIFGGTQRPVDLTRLCLLTAAILTVALITVGQTYLQQRRMLRGIVVICSYCRKVRIDEITWQQIEHFVAQRSHAEFSHSICPSCHYRALRDMESSPASSI